MIKDSLNKKKSTFLRNLNNNKGFLLLCAPAIILTFIFAYIPMYGISMAFTDFSIRQGILGSPWVGFQWFEEFFSSIFFGRILRNTVALSVLNIIFSFPLPIVFALLVNEVRFKWFKKSIQTVSYMPHFISTVIVVGIMTDVFSPSGGIVNSILQSLNIIDKPINFFYDSKYFRGLYIGSEIWQHMGWNSIIYLATISSIDPHLYEAAEMDGAGKWRQLTAVTLPGIRNVVVTLLILNFGSVMSVGFEKILLMYNPATYETSDVISTFIYRLGIVGGAYGYSAAVGLFNSVINLILLIVFNAISRKCSEVSLW